MATLPGMDERTVTISSLGKTFTVTGWKVGWAIGAPDLVNAVNQAHQFITFAVSSPLQAAAATALDLPASFFEKLQSSYQAKRDRMLQVLEDAGFKVLKPSGSYFIMADWRGVACIPPGAFYQEGDKHLAQHLARFAVCKKDETLDAAAERLSRLGKYR